MGKIKICLDAGHYGKYNQSPANSAYYESVMTWKLHMLLKQALEHYGFEVITTRSSQAKDLSVYNRGTKSKGCDLLLSVHSNAVGSEVNESVDRPVVIVPLNGKGDELGKKLANCMADVMGTEQPGNISTRKGKYGGEFYGVIRGAVDVGTVGMILEHSFHTNTRSTNWLLKNSNLEKLAKAEARVIAEHYGVASNGKNENEIIIPKTPFVVDVLIDDLNYRSEPSMNGKELGTTEKGIFTINLVDGNWGKLESGAGWIYLANPDYCTIRTSIPFVVEVTIDDLNIRTGPGTTYVKTGEYTEKGKFTITEIKEGKGSDTGWGKLKSGAGWISLDYAKRV